MKTYKKPISILVAADAEELLAGSSPYRFTADGIEQQYMLDNTQWSNVTVGEMRNDGVDIEVDAKGWDCWE